jgi:putative transposase
VRAGTDIIGVTMPRMCVPGGTYLVTRTCANRRFLLKPSALVNQTFLYCLARAAALHGILLHALCVESSHFHVVVTDTRGELSQFMHWLDRHVARCLVEHYQETHPRQHLEGIWSKGHFGATLLLTHEAILDAIVYALTNPQKDGLVVDYRKWPGLCSRPRDWLAPERFAPRPELYFDPSKTELAKLGYRFTVPPQFADRDPEAFVRDVEALIRDAQRATCATLAAERRSFLGVNGVLAADPFDAPKSVRPKGRLKPCLAAGGHHEVMIEAKRALRYFRQRYREQWRLFCTGAAAIFPGGTLLMRRLFNVACEPLDAPWCLRAAATG